MVDVLCARNKKKCDEKLITDIVISRKIFEKKNKFLHSLISVDILGAEKKKKKKLVQICIMLILNLLRLDLRR